MLEKIGLPAKPSLRGNNWVVDASHCQGCSSQFTFINRKHHCRRCGGLFCNGCTQQRMHLRGQGDLPVRVCDPCKKLEEAARFEMRHGFKGRSTKGSLKQMVKSEDEVLNQILGRDEDTSLGQLSSNDMGSSMQRATSTASSSNVGDALAHDGLGDIRRSHSVDDHNSLQNDMGSASPEELRQRAVEEKKKYKILKGEGKPEDALRAYKRGKELERQAEALEISLRKNRKRILSSGNKADTQNKGSFKESGRKSNQFPKAGAERDDFATELRELGWSDMDIHHEDKKPANLSLEGELSSLLGDVIPKTGNDAGTRGIDKTPVVALKRKALALKREGKLAEAKEELKKAKILEKQLEEQELLNEAGDSDDELSAIIQSIEDDEQDDLLIQYEEEPHFDHFISTADDLGVESNFEVTDEDTEDPEIAAALKSLGWTEDSDCPDNIVPQSAPLDREALSTEILSLKREALNQKRAGNVAEAMAHLKKAKLLERDLEDSESQGGNLVIQNPRIIQRGSISQDSEKLSKTAKVDEGNIDFTKDMDYKVPRKSRSMIQKELLRLKRNALALRREGKIDEAEEELKKCKVLEHQLEEMDNATKVKATGTKEPNFAYSDSVTIDLPVGEGEDNVTDQDMHDPTYSSILRNLGWNDEDNEVASHPSKPSKQKDKFSVNVMESPLMEATSDIPAMASSRSKAELQRELLSLKRKALSLRRQGKNDEAEEVLKTAKELEDRMADMEAPKKFQAESNWPRDRVIERPLESTIDKGVEEDVTKSDMDDPALPSVLKNVGWKDEELGSVTMLEKPSKEVSGNPLHFTGPSATQSSLGVSVAMPRSKGEIQRQLLNLKRKALTLRRQGETEEAEELLEMARVLEVQMEELEAPKDNLLDTSKKNLGSFQSLVNHEKQGNLVPQVGVNTGSVMMAMVSGDKAVESSQLMEVDHPFLGESGSSGKTGFTCKNEAAKSTVFIPPYSQSVNLMDLMTGNNWTSSQPAGKLEDKGNFGSDISSGKTALRKDSASNFHEDSGSKNDIQTDKKEVVHAYENANVLEANSAQGSAFQSKQTLLRQEVLAHKRKAVALKREGKLAEAREELRQAKLLEKSLEEDKIQPKTISPDVSKTTSKLPSDGRKEDGASNLATKPLSSRDRFKLQQESLSHKRRALKLRREGQMDEAEAEFEKAKNLEAQLEELAAQDSKSSANEAEPINDIVVEDFLDPQLLSALKAIGLDDANMATERPEKSEPVKHGAGKGDNLSQERMQLEDRIKAEKVKAVNLKRSGKQAEALDALRRAKLFEKKLNSLASN